MKRIDQWPIYYRILLMAVLLITLLSGALTLNAWGSMDSIVEQQLIARGAEIGAHTAALSANFILVEDYSGLHDLVEQATVNSNDIRYVLVTDNKGRLLAHTFSRGIPKGLLDINLRSIDKGFRSVTIASDEGNIHDILVPVESGEVGFVRVGMTEEFTRDAIVNRVRELGLVAFLVCVLALFISARLTSLITDPISRLAKVAEAIKKGDLKVRAPTADGGEIGELAVAFNDMADSLITTNEEKELLLKELQAKEQLRNTLISKLLTAQEDERKNLSRELHDETSQALTSLMLTMRILAEDAEDEGQKEALLLGRDVAEKILRDIRELAVELRPPVLDDLGLVAAIEKYLEKLRDRCGLRIDLQAADCDSWQSGPMDSQVAVALYRIVQESLSNVIKHSDAASVVVALSRKERNICLKIADDGRGLSDEDLIRAQQEKRLGIYGMQERAELLGGTFQIQSTVGEGTVLTIMIPISETAGGGRRV
jgi:signal transduction histidine kinase